jgi:hypothetical protein
MSVSPPESTASVNSASAASQSPKLQQRLGQVHDLIGKESLNSWAIRPAPMSSASPSVSASALNR